MKSSKTLITSMLIGFSTGSWAQTAADYIGQGQSFLAATNLISANNSFSNAVALSANNQTGNVLYAATRLLILPYQATGSNFLTRLGVSTVGRNVYHWTARMPADTNGVLLAPVGVDASEVTAELRTNLLPELIAAEANLATVTDTNFLLNLSIQDTEVAAVQIDYGDVLLLRSLLESAAYFGYTINSWNVYAQFTALRSLYLRDGLNPGQLLAEYPELLTFSTTNDMAAAKTAFSNAVGLYLQASSFIRGRPINETHLFNYDPAVSGKESGFRRVITGLRAALDGAVALQVGRGESFDITVDMVPLFDGLHPGRSFLPQFSGRDLVLGTLDETFGGAITGLDLGTAETFVAKYLPTVPDFGSGGFVQNQFVAQLNVLPGRGYAIESSGDLINWTLISHEFATNTVIPLSGPRAAGSRLFYRAREESNDRFDNAYVIDGLPTTSVGSTVGATSEPGDPPVSFSGQTLGMGSPVWWVWTAPFSGEVGISVDAASFVPVLGVFTGSSLSNLVQVPNFGSSSSEFGFQASAGTRYFIAVESGNSALQGNFTLELAGVPANDSFANRELLNGAAVSVAGCNILATQEQNEPSYDGQSVWYAWGAPAAGSVTVSVAGLRYSSIRVFTGSNVTNLLEVPTFSIGGNSVTFDTEAGTAYQIQIDSFQTGNFMLSLNFFAGLYRFYTSVYPSEGGSVVLHPQADTNGMYAAGTSVTVSAQTAPGFVFEEWYMSDGSVGSNAQIVIVMNNSQSLEADFQPTNDDFANSIVLTGTRVSVDGSTLGASNESGEPGFGETLWYSWTAPVSGSVTFWLAWLGSVNHPEMNIYRGNQLTSLSPVSIFSYGAQRSVTSQTFDSVAGTTYQIQISGYSATFSMLLTLSAGYYDLSDSAYPPAGGSVLVSTPPSTNGFYAEGTLVNLTAQPAPGFVFAGWSGSVTNGGSTPDLTLLMNGSKTLQALFHPSNDDFASRIGLVGAHAIVNGTTAGASTEPGETCTLCQTVWYSWTATASGSVTLTIQEPQYSSVNLFTGNTLSNLVRVSSYSNGSSMTFDAIAGMTYQIQMDGDGATFSLALDLSEGFYALLESVSPPEGGTILASPPPSTNGLYAAGAVVSLTAQPAAGWTFSGWSGTQSNTNSILQVMMNGSLSVQALFRTPSTGNDEFSQAIVIYGRNVVVTGTNVGATKEAGEPSHAGNSGGASVWWTWIPQTSGTATISTVGSSFDTLLAVYTGGSVSSLTRIASDDDYAGGTTSLVTFAAIAGTTYRIAVDGYRGAEGSIVLNVQ